MDYKEKYEELKSKIQNLHDRLTGELRQVIEEEVPETIESEDERMRNAAINACKYMVDNFENSTKQYEDAIAWLEKQGEQKPTERVEINKSLSDAVITGLNKYNGENYWKSPWALDSTGLKYPLYFANLGATWQKEQNPAWSEDDDENFKWFEKFFRAESVLSDARDIPQERYLWFKSLKERVQLKQEWSEEDEYMINFISEKLFSLGATPLCSEIKWLKSLKDRYIWKPSDEQIKILNEVLNFAANHESLHWNNYIFGTMNNLIRQLKKLREE